MKNRVFDKVPSNPIIHRNYYKDSIKRTIKSPSFYLPLLTILTIFLFGLIFECFINPSIYLTTNLENDYISPCLKYPFGTNAFGHNQFYLIFIGSYKTLLLTVCASLLNVIIGCVFGIVWGYSKRFDSFMFIIKNLFDNTPLIFFYIIIIIALGNGFIPLLLVFVLSGWLDSAYLVRNNLMILKSKDYNRVSHLYKIPLHKVAVTNYLPSILPILFNRLVICIPQAIALEITLSYFGFSFVSNNYSLGELLSTSISRGTYYTHPFMFFIPLITLFIINLSFHIISKTISKNFTKEEI